MSISSPSKLCVVMSLCHEVLKLLYVENLTLHESACLSHFSVDILVAHKRRDILGGPGSAEDILRVIPPESYISQLEFRSC